MSSKSSNKIITDNRKKFELNYLYFSSLLALFFILNTLCTLRMHISGMLSLLFFINTTLQALTETVFLALVAIYVNKIFKNVGIKILIVVVTFVILFHLISYFCDQTMNSSFVLALKLLFGGEASNIILTIKGTGISYLTWVLICITLIALPVIGVLYYQWMQKLQKKPWVISSLSLVKALLILLLALCTTDFLSYCNLSFMQHKKYSQKLLWGNTFFSPQTKTINIPLKAVHLTAISQKVEVINSEREKRFLDFARSPWLKSMDDEQNTKSYSSQPEVIPKVFDKLHLTQKKVFSALQRPNIYIFVIESLRQDLINKQSAPNFTKFQQENISCPLSFSSAISTHISWFSIFSSILPIYWNDFQKGKHEGAPPLKMLKELGYKIHLLSSTEMNYFNSDELLFGNNNILLDSFLECTDLPPCERDAKIMKELTQKSSLQADGNIFLVFLQSTHSEYSFPIKKRAKFTPFDPYINYLFLGLFNTQKISIKNRYLNALNYVDTLFGKFLKALKQQNQLENAVIVVTGDHGEELGEKGAFFHGTELNNLQTRIPIYYKLGSYHPIEISSITSHVDIFPTILHFLTGEHCTTLQGKSVLDTQTLSYTLTAKQNGGKNPKEFCLNNGKLKLLGKLKKSLQVEIFSISDLDDNELSLPNTEQVVLEQFGSALEKLATQID